MDKKSYSDSQRLEVLMRHPDKLWINKEDGTTVYNGAEIWHADPRKAVDDLIERVSLDNIEIYLFPDLFEDLEKKYPLLQYEWKISRVAPQYKITIFTRHSYICVGQWYGWTLLDALNAVREAELKLVQHAETGRTMKIDANDLIPEGYFEVG